MSQNMALVQQERTPYQIMDALDDDLIKAELENRIVDTWVYSFVTDGKPQSGLSKIGVDACCTEMAKTGNVIKEGKIEFQLDPTDKEFVLFQGMAIRFVVDNDGKQIEMETVNGTKRQWTKMKAKGKIIDDPFWYEKGAMKALRNARSRLIPEEIRTKIITLAKQKGRVKPIEAPANADPSPVKEAVKCNNAPLPLSDAQLKMIRAKIGEIKEFESKDKDNFYTWLKGKAETMDVAGKIAITRAGASDIIDRFNDLLNEYTGGLIKANNDKPSDDQPKDDISW